MKISLLEYTIMLDALGASISINDSVGLFTYTNNTRKEVWQRLNSKMQEKELEVDSEVS